MLISGLTAAQAFLLLYAGTVKLRHPETATATLATLGLRGRGWPFALAIGELAVAVAALTLPSALSGPLLAVTFGAFAVVTAILVGRDADQDCGCFGVGGHRPSWSQAIADGLLGVLALAAMQLGGRGALALVAARPAAGIAALGLALALAPVLFAAMHRGPQQRIADLPERLVTGSALLLERRISRRSALIRVTVAGSALAVAPLRYLLYPGTALAVVAPSGCSGGLCTDGWTAFCCEINSGLNACPAGTFPGGWWKCTDYRGRQLCSETGVRYYVDCNRLPGHAFPGGCQCAGGDCGNRRIDCNVFRYGQCNTQIGGVTEVVCRMVTCTNPGSIAGLNCSASVAVDNAVCAHEASCLEPPAQVLAPAGGV
jgi:hypothetical protein